jgi:dTDP-4-dehydrorhamnose 3,5-epimerase-like enzyme
LTLVNSDIDSKSNNVFQFDVESYLDPVRGDTFVFEGIESLPDFRIERVFWVQTVSEWVARGNHANKRTDEILVAVSGGLTVAVTDVDGTVERFILNQPNQGLYVEHGQFIEMTNFSNDCILLVLANQKYDVSENVTGLRAYTEWIKPNHPL